MLDPMARLDDYMQYNVQCTRPSSFRIGQPVVVGGARSTPKITLSSKIENQGGRAEQVRRG